MSAVDQIPDEEPIVAVGLLEDIEAVTIHLIGDFAEDHGTHFPGGEYKVECPEGLFRFTGPRSAEFESPVLIPKDSNTARFSIETTIGSSFHWQQTDVQTFLGKVRFEPLGATRFAVINDVPLENYITSVICSEMAAGSPLELIKAHSVISRSWLLAQRGSARSGRRAAAAKPELGGEWIRWYDHEAHAAFDVCADDHCQRYHGLSRVRSPAAHRAVGETRGQVLTFEGELCDTRYSKSCGGVTEDFRVAWGDVEVQYLVPVFDGPGGRMPSPPLSEDNVLRDYIQNPPAVYCNCREDAILDSILTSHDRKTRDFFRWKTSLSASRATELVEQKLGVNLGRIVALEPVERGLSGRLKRLRLVGEAASLIVGKELEIRRVLSTTHLYSAAFVVDPEGPSRRPDAFVLSGAGWGHGVGLCQIGAAVMAWRGSGYEEILKHYYPATVIRGLYD